MIKSPFLLIRNFLSPLEVENVLLSVVDIRPDYLDKKTPLRTVLRKPAVSMRIFNKIEEFADSIEQYYGTEIDEFHDVTIEWYPENCQQVNVECENCKPLNSRQWKRINNNDLTAIIFLKDYNKSADFDEDFEVYGGELEFLNHQFSITPERGTMVIFPSNQYFLNSIKSPKFGDAYILKLHMICKPSFKYDPKNYEGNYKLWFN